MEDSFEQIERRLGTLEQDLRGLRVELNARMDRLEGRIDRLEDQIHHLVYWQLGLLGAIAASILATVLTRFL
ncbi:MAG: hypothetical protein ACE5Q6_27625 [Dehalococcoidia bacterium]